MNLSKLSLEEFAGFVSSALKKELHRRYDVAPVELDEVLTFEDYRIATRLLTSLDA